MAKFKDLDIVSTVGTSVITNKMDYEDIPETIRRYEGYSYENCLIKCRDVEKGKEIASFIVDLVEDYKSDSNNSLSAEIETIYQIIEEDYKAYSTSTNHSEDLLETLKSGYEKHIDLLTFDKEKASEDITELAKIYAISPASVKKDIKSYVERTIRPKNSSLSTLITRSFNKVGKEKVILNKNVNLRFIATDSLMGIVAAIILFYIVEGETIEKGKDSDFVEIHYNLNDMTDLREQDLVFQIHGLDVTDQKVFVNEGVSELFTVLDTIIKDNNRDISFSITGGHKGVIPYVTMFAQINHITSYYMFNGAKLMKLPEVDISISQEYAEKYYTDLKQFTRKNHFTNVDENNEKTINNLLNHNLIYRHNNDYKLTGLGSLVSHTITDIERRESNSGSVYEKFIYSYFIDNKDLINTIYFDSDSDVSIVSNLEFISNKSSSHPSAELDILMVDQNGEYVVSEIKSIGAKSEVAKQVPKYFNLMESILTHQNIYSCDAKNVIEQLKKPKEINIIIVGDKDKDFRVSSLFNRDYGKEKNRNWFEMINDLFMMQIEGSDSITMRNLKLRFTIADMSVISTKDKIDSLTLYDYDPEKENWKENGFVFTSNTSLKTIRKSLSYDMRKIMEKQYGSQGVKAVANFEKEIAELEKAKKMAKNKKG